GGLLADRVQALGADHPVQLAVALAARRGDLEPARLAAAERQRLGPEDLQDVHPTGVGTRARAHVSEATQVRQRAGAIAISGPAGRSARYCGYLAASASMPAALSWMLAVPSTRTHHSCVQS